jgi:hypothetical protein
MTGFFLPYKEALPFSSETPDKQPSLDIVRPVIPKFNINSIPAI